MSIETPTDFHPAKVFQPEMGKKPHYAAPGSSTFVGDKTTGINLCFIEKIAEIAQKEEQNRKIWQDIFQTVYAASGISGIQTLNNAVNLQLRNNGSAKEISLIQQKENTDLAHFSVKNKYDGSGTSLLLKLRDRVAENLARSIIDNTLTQLETEKAFQEVYQAENQEGIAMLESAINRSLKHLKHSESVTTKPCGLESGSIYFIIKSPESESGFLIFPQDF